MIKNFDRENVYILWMLIIDIFGKKFFNNLRNRGSFFCDIVILVVDILYGFEFQIIEVINIFKFKKMFFFCCI